MKKILIIITSLFLITYGIFNVNAQGLYSVNVDSNYGDYLDVAIQYEDDDEQLQDYPIVASINGSPDMFRLETPTTLGDYTFLHWFNLDTNTIESSNNIVFRGNITDDVNWRAIYTGVSNYDIDLNMESGVIGNIRYETDTYSNNTIGTIEINAPVIDEIVPEGINFLAEAPELIGYTFDGWFDTSDNSLFTTDSLLTFNSSPFGFVQEITRDWTYEARYTEITTYTFFADSDLPNPPDFEYEIDGEGSLFDYPVDITVNQGSDVYITAPTTNIGSYEFYGWYDNDTNQLISGNPTLFIYENIQENISIQARYLQELTVTFDVNGGEPLDPIIVYDGNAIQNEPLTTRDGFYLQGWNDLSTQFEIISFPYTITENTTLQAQWNPVYTITFNSNGGTPVNSIEVNAGFTASEPLEPSKFGYLFQGWFTDNQTFQNEYDFDSTVSNNLTLHAKWELGSDSDISETLNTWIINSNISSMFIVLIVLIAISVSLGIIGAKMFVILISNLSLIFVFTALGFIPLWIVLVAGLAIIGFIIMMVFGGKNNG